MIQINVLAHSDKRLPYISKSLELLCGIKEINKSQIKIAILCSDISDNYKTSWVEICKKIKNNGIDCVLLVFNSFDTEGLNYMSKIHYSIDSECEYSCSMDDDILISTFLWDFIIDNISVLQNDNTLLMAPLISNGIPSVEMFIEDFCTQSDSNELGDIFKSTHIPDLWGMDYSSLIYENDIEFYKCVNELNGSFKGIHPMRISNIAHEKLSSVIHSNYKKMISDNEYKIEYYKFPYFCNSFYFIKTNTWREIISDYSLYKDLYDEIPLNLYMKKHNLNMAFIRNGFCLHMAYNTIGSQNQENIENYFINNLIPNI